jgi:hypothetical protein
MITRAEIRWLRPDEGGRTIPPKGPQYSTVARFSTQTDEQWSQEAWSLVLSLEEGLGQDLRQKARVRFLADDAIAPKEWLKPGSAFELYEGRKRVAEGRVLECCA